MSLSKQQIKTFCYKACKLLLIALLFFLIFIPASTSEIILNLKERTMLMAEASSFSPINLTDELKSIMFKDEDKKVIHDSLRGIYITAGMASSDKFQPLVDKLIESGGNFIVMDIEMSGGKLAFIPENAYLSSKNPGSTTLANLKTIIKNLHKQDIYVVARQVIFNDPYAGSRYDEWRIKNKWGGLFDYRWLDPSNPEVQRYNLLITKELAELGFDEVQYDYIRFPAENHYNLEYYYDETLKERWEVINDFLAEAHQLTQEYDIKLGVDVFGATIWGDVDWRSVGQLIPEIAKNVDVIYPMTYPSHISPGYFGFKNPYGNPGSFVRGSITKFVEAADGNAEIRTWIQGFPLKTPNFGSWYMKEQVNATYDAGANDFVIWSPGNIYTYSWSSMKILPPYPPSENTIDEVIEAPTEPLVAEKNKNIEPTEE